MKNWKEETKYLIEKSGMTTIEISKGAGVNYHWLTSFRKTDAPPNPSIELVQKVHDFLSKQKKGR